MKLLLQRVRRAGASNSRGALFFVFVVVFAIGAALPSITTIAASPKKVPPQNATVSKPPPSLNLPTSEDYYVFATVGCVSPPSGMIGWWPGDDNFDDLIYGNNGSPQNGVSFGPGEVADAFSFDDSLTQFVTIPNTPALNNVGSQVTIDGWINPGGVSQSGEIYFGKTLYGANDYLLFFNGGFGGLSSVVKTNGVEIETHGYADYPTNTQPYVPSDNTWTHIALTFDGSTITVYANGMVVGQQQLKGSQTIDGDDEPFDIGGRAVDNGTGKFYGLIDEVEVFNRALTNTEIATLYAVGSFGKCKPSCAPVPGGITDWWPGDDNANDIQGSRNGTLVGGVSFAPGEVHDAFSFDGSTGSVDLGSANLLGGATQATIDAWVYPTNFDNYQAIIYPGPVNIWWIQLLPDLGQGPGHVRFAINNGSSGSADTTNSIPLNKWSHIAMTWDGNTALLYINGVQDPTTLSASGSIPDDSADSKAIGSRGGIDQFFGGLIDEVEIFNRALSSGEINAIVSAGPAGKCKAQCTTPPSGMISWWTGDDTAQDIQGGNNGILQGSATYAGGEVGQAFSFDGNGYVRVPDNPSLRLPDAPFSIDLWFNTNADVNSVDQIILSKGVSDNNEEYTIDLEQGGFIYWDYGNQGYVTTNSGIISSNQWYHLVVTYDPNANPRGAVYLNGVAQPIAASGSDPHIQTSGSDLYIGTQNAGSPYYGGRVSFSGVIDEVEIFNRLLTPEEIATIFSSGSSGKCKPTCTTPPSGMVSWWPGDGNAHDIQDNNDGSLQGGATFGSGKVNEAFSFDGNDGEVAIPDNANQNTGAQISIDAWIFPRSSGHGRPILNKRNGLNVGGYTFETTNSPAGNDNGLQFVIWVGGSPQLLVTPANVLTNNEWQHVAATYDGSTMKIYVNAVEVASQPATGAIDPTNDTLVIGRNIPNQSFDFDGLIDEVELFNVGLTAGQVQAIYNAGSAGKCRTCDPQPPDMIAWYKAEGDATDSLGNHNGTANGNVTFVTGEVGKAFSFDGTGSSYISIPPFTPGLMRRSMPGLIRAISPAASAMRICQASCAELRLASPTPATI